MVFTHRYKAIYACFTILLAGCLRTSSCRLSTTRKLELVDRYFVVERSWASSELRRTGTAKGETRLCVKNASSDTLNDSLWVN